MGAWASIPMLRSREDSLVDLLQVFCLLGLVCTQHDPQTFLLAIFVSPLLLLQFSAIFPAFPKEELGGGQQNETRSWGRS